MTLSSNSILSHIYEVGQAFLSSKQGHRFLGFIVQTVLVVPSPIYRRGPTTQMTRRIITIWKKPSSFSSTILKHLQQTINKTTYFATIVTKVSKIKCSYRTTKEMFTKLEGILELKEHRIQSSSQVFFTWKRTM